MSARFAGFATDKEALLMRSALCRLRLRRATHDLRSSLHWSRAAAPALRPIAFGLVLSLIGLRRAARGVVILGRIVFFAKLARSLVDYGRRLAGAPACAIEQTDSGGALSLASQPRNST